MAQQTGMRSQLILGFESVFGTAPAAGYVMAINSSSIKGARALNAAATIRGNRNPGEPFAGNMSVAGSIAVPVDSDALGWWLRAMFGTPTTTGAGPYTHVFKVANTQPSISIEHQMLALATPQYFLYEGCKIGSFSLEQGGDGELVMTLEIVGANETPSASPFDAAPTDKTNINRFENFHATLKEGGSTISNAKTVSFQCNFGLDTSQYVIGSNGILGNIPEGLVQISGSIATFFEDMVLLNKAINSTESAIELTLTKSTDILVIEVPELRYQQNSPAIEGPQGMDVSLEYQGYYEDDGDASSILITLTNTIASYA